MYVYLYAVYLCLAIYPNQCTRQIFWHGVHLAVSYSKRTDAAKKQMKTKYFSADSRQEVHFFLRFKECQKWHLWVLQKGSRSTPLPSPLSSVPPPHPHFTGTSLFILKAWQTAGFGLQYVAYWILTLLNGN